MAKKVAVLVTVLSFVIALLTLAVTTAFTGVATIVFDIDHYAVDHYISYEPRGSVLSPLSPPDVTPIIQILLAHYARHWVTLTPHGDNPPWTLSNSDARYLFKRLLNDFYERYTDRSIVWVPVATTLASLALTLTVLHHGVLRRPHSLGRLTTPIFQLIHIATAVLGSWTLCSSVVYLITLNAGLQHFALVRFHELSDSSVINILSTFHQTVDLPSWIVDLCRSLALVYWATCVTVIAGFRYDLSWLQVRSAGAAQLVTTRHLANNRGRVFDLWSLAEGLLWLQVRRAGATQLIPVTRQITGNIQDWVGTLQRVSNAFANGFRSHAVIIQPYVKAGIAKDHRIAELEQQIKSHFDALLRRNRKYQDLVWEVDVLKHRRGLDEAATSKRLRHLSTTIATLGTENEALQKDNEALSTALSRSEATIADNTETIEDLSDEVNDLRPLRDVAEDQKKRIVDVKKEKDGLAKKIAELEREVDTKAEELKKKGLEVDKYRMSYEEAKEDCDAAYLHRHVLDGEIKRLKASATEERTRLEETLANQEQTIGNLEQEKEEVAAALMRSEANAARGKAEAEEEHQKLHHTIDAQTTTISTITRKHQQLTAAWHDAERVDEERTKAIRHLSRIVEELKPLQSMVRDQELEITKAQEEKADMQAAHTQRLQAAEEASGQAKTLLAEAQITITELRATNDQLTMERSELKSTLENIKEENMKASEEVERQLARANERIASLDTLGLAREELVEKLKMANARLDAVVDRSIEEEMEYRCQVTSLQWDLETFKGLWMYYREIAEKNGCISREKRDVPAPARVQFAASLVAPDPDLHRPSNEGKAYSPSTDGILKNLGSQSQPLPPSKASIIEMAVERHPEAAVRGAALMAPLAREITMKSSSKMASRGLAVSDAGPSNQNRGAESTLSIASAKEEQDCSVEHAIGVPDCSMLGPTAFMGTRRIVPTLALRTQVRKKDTFGTVVANEAEPRINLNQISRSKGWYTKRGLARLFSNVKPAPPPGPPVTTSQKMMSPPANRKREEKGCKSFADEVPK